MQLSSTPLSLAKGIDVTTAQTDTTDIVVVGAGFAGIYMVHQAHELGLNVIGVERGSGVGGTWYWNRYPGLRCDVESLDYSYSFNEEIQQEWVWTEKFPAQPDILAYLEFVATKLDITKDFQFDTEVTGATWNESTQRWSVATTAGTIDTKYVVWGTGMLSIPKIPNIPGMDSFEGVLLNPAIWPHEPVSFAGKRVAVLGTGSTGIQVIPIVAETAEHLFVLQRTPSFSLPAHNATLSPERVADVKSRYKAYRAEARTQMLGCVTETRGEPFEVMGPDLARAELERNYNYGSPMRFASAIVDTVASEEANNFTASFAREKIRARIADPALAEKLMPDHFITTRRLCIDTDYYETYNRDNVSLVDVKKNPIVEFTENGIKAGDTEYPLDVIVLATGFDAVSGNQLRIYQEGRDGITLQEKWRDRPYTYMGMMTANFPNMYMVYGPMGPFTNQPPAHEAQINWIADAIKRTIDSGLKTLEPTQKAEDDWMELCDSGAALTLFPKVNSWINGSNIPGKPVVNYFFMGGMAAYMDLMNEDRASQFTNHFLQDGKSAEVKA
jgi:cation diffusion facilitator CzcD-associated flavoprotein CzcO